MLIDGIAQTQFGGAPQTSVLVAWASNMHLVESTFISEIIYGVLGVPQPTRYPVTLL